MTISKNFKSRLKIKFLNKKDVNKANYYMNWSRKIQKLPLEVSKSELKGC